MTTLDDKAQALWDEMKALDVQMHELVAKRENLFQQYNECLALLRDHEREEQPKTKWDEALEEWVDVTLAPYAEVIPLHKKEPDLGAS